MFRTSPSTDKSTAAIAPSNNTVFNVAVNTPVIVLPDMRNSGQEVARRYIQNVGNNAAYFAVDATAGPGVYHGVIPALSLPWDISDWGNGSISIFCNVTGGTIISTMTLIRKNAQDIGQNIIGGTNTGAQ